MKKLGWSVNSSVASSPVIAGATLLGKSIALIKALGAHEAMRDLAVCMALEAAECCSLYSTSAYKIANNPLLYAQDASIVNMVADWQPKQ